MLLQFQQLDLMFKQFNIKILTLLFGMLEDKIKLDYYGNIIIKILKELFSLSTQMINKEFKMQDNNFIECFQKIN